MTITTMEELEAVPEGEAIRVTSDGRTVDWTRTPAGFMYQNSAPLEARLFTGAVRNGHVVRVGPVAPHVPGVFRAGDRVNSIEEMEQAPLGTIIQRGTSTSLYIKVEPRGDQHWVTYTEGREPRDARHTHAAFHPDRNDWRWHTVPEPSASAEPTVADPVPAPAPTQTDPVGAERVSHWFRQGDNVFLFVTNWVESDQFPYKTIVFNSVGDFVRYDGWQAGCRMVPTDAPPSRAITYVENMRRHGGITFGYGAEPVVTHARLIGALEPLLGPEDITPDELREAIAGLGVTLPRFTLEVSVSVDATSRVEHSLGGGVSAEGTFAWTRTFTIPVENDGGRCACDDIDTESIGTYLRETGVQFTDVTDYEIGGCNGSDCEY